MLFLASFMALFFEILVIRSLSSEVRALACVNIHGTPLRHKRGAYLEDAVARVSKEVAGCFGCR